MAHLTAHLAVNPLQIAWLKLHVHRMATGEGVALVCTCTTFPHVYTCVLLVVKLSLISLNGWAYQKELPLYRVVHPTSFQK